MPELRTKVDARAATSPIVDEPHVVGEDTAERVFLDEEPDPAQAIAVNVSGGGTAFTKVASGPAAGEFALVDGTSELVFNAADDGTAVEVDYEARGSEARARDFNRIRQKLQGVKVVSDAEPVVLDFGDEWTNRVTLGGDRTIDVGTFPPAGAFVALEVIQDATGTRVPTFNADFDFGADGAPTYSTAAGTRDLSTFYSTGSKLLHVGTKLGFA